MHLVGELTRQVARERGTDAVHVRYRSVLPTAGQRVLPGDQGLGADPAAGVHTDELGKRFVRVGGESRDVDERLHVRDADRGVADDGAAVGVSDQDDRAVDRPEDAADVRSRRRRGRDGGSPVR